ncbi:outer membrane receptor for ferric coprogen and ferric-rhodotorulic acid [Janthinobacterium sp. Marseille]|nr:outer membrane receptor for ferric coprogen and ferric-rhodotorulic acid [Janthinobacterium sp. Marseille]
MSSASPRLVERRLNHAVRVALISMALLSASTLIPASNAAANTLDAVAARHYNIAPGPLGRTLSTFSAQAGIALSFDPALTEGLLSPALSGTYSARDAISRLLTGSGLELVQRVDGTYTLGKAAVGAAAPRESSTLPEVQVTAVQSATTEGSGSYTTGSASTATRLNLSIRETPQSVSVITRQRMDDQGLSQLSDVVTQTTGLVMAQSGNGGSDSSPIYSRGFTVENYQVDGVGQVFSGYNSLFQTNDMAIYDRVEVVRGATGLMNGVGSPSATINLMRKRPTAQFQASAKVEAGSWNYYRAEADLSAPLNEAGTLRGRVVAAYQENDSYIDRLHEKKEILYGIVEADLSPTTLATFGVSLQNHDATGHSRGARPAYFSDGSRAIWARSDSAAAEWAYSKRHNQAIFASIEHQFDNEWMAKATLSQGKSNYDELLGYATGGNPDRASGAGTILYASRWVGNPTQNSLDLYASGPFNLLGRKHDLVVGATVARTRVDAPTYGNWTLLSIPNIYTWDGNTPLNPNKAIQGNYTDEENVSSAYSTVRFKPTDALSLILGSRITSWERLQSSVKDARYENGKVTPYAGLVYDFNKNWSGYASYTDIFKPQNNKTASGDYIDPLLGKSYEIGAKAEFFDKRLNLGMALYKIEQDNLAVSIPNVFAPDGSQAYRAVSGTSTRGFEAELSGELARNWQGSIGFSRGITVDRNKLRLNTNIPQNTFKVFTTYRLAGFGDGLTVGGGVRWQSEIYSDNQGPAKVRFTQAAYSVVDLMARYEISKQLTLTANLYNAFDKSYYTATGNSYYGAPRNMRVGLDMRF